MNLKELGANLGLEEDEYLELIQLFATSGADDIKALQTALEARDVDQVMRRAHTIKGASGNLGLVDVAETAKTIELLANNNQLDDMAQAVENLKTQIEAIQAFVGN